MQWAVLVRRVVARRAVGKATVRTTETVVIAIVMVGETVDDRTGVIIGVGEMVNPEEAKVDDLHQSLILIGITITVHCMRPTMCS